MKTHEFEFTRFHSPVSTSFFPLTPDIKNLIASLKRDFFYDKRNFISESITRISAAMHAAKLPDYEELKTFPFLKSKYLFRRFGILVYDNFDIFLINKFYIPFVNALQTNILITDILIDEIVDNKIQVEMLFRYLVQLSSPDKNAEFPFCDFGVDLNPGLIHDLIESSEVFRVFFRPDSPFLEEFNLFSPFDPEEEYEFEGFYGGGGLLKQSMVEDLIDSLKTLEPTLGKKYSYSFNLLFDYLMKVSKGEISLYFVFQEYPNLEIPTEPEINI
jgi:hypothetical protein